MLHNFDRKDLDGIDECDGWKNIEKVPPYNSQLKIILYKDSLSYDFAFNDDDGIWYLDGHKGKVTREIAYWRFAPIPPLSIMNFIG